MKLYYKKYLYLINDLTSLLLKKDFSQAEEHAEKLRRLLIFVACLLALSIILNLILLLPLVAK